MDRYYKCAKKFGLDIVIRITSDAPFVDPELLDDLMKIFFEGKKSFKISKFLLFMFLAIWLGSIPTLLNDLGTMSRNVIYTGEKNILYADMVEMEISTKDTKIFMNDNIKKVLIIGTN